MVTPNLSDYAAYTVLTTKSPVTIGQGGTGATTYKGARDALGLQYIYFTANTQKSITLDGVYRGLLILCSAYSACVGIYRVQCNSAGGVTNPIALIEASGVTFDVSTAYTLKVTTTQNT